VQSVHTDTTPLSVIVPPTTTAEPVAEPVAEPAAEPAAAGPAPAERSRATAPIPVPASSEEPARPRLSDHDTPRLPGVALSTPVRTDVPPASTGTAND